MRGLRAGECSLFNVSITSIMPTLPGFAFFATPPPPRVSRLTRHAGAPSSPSSPLLSASFRVVEGRGGNHQGDFAPSILLFIYSPHPPTLTRSDLWRKGCCCRG